MVSLVYLKTGNIGGKKYTLFQYVCQWWVLQTDNHRANTYSEEVFLSEVPSRINEFKDVIITEMKVVLVFYFTWVESKCLMPGLVESLRNVMH